MYKQVVVVLKGGPGSGHKGHKGRPGKQGGSLPEGASSTKPEDSKSPIPEKISKFDTEKWTSMSVPDRMSAWAKLSQGERDRQADASITIKNVQNDILLFAGDRPKLSGTVGEAITARVAQMGDFVHSSSAKKISDLVSKMDSHIEKLGADPDKRYTLAMEAVDTLIAQEYESMGRQLGDHGIHHILGNIEIAGKILSTYPGEDSDTDLAQIYVTNVFHDTGYMAPPSRNFIDEGHPRWSMEHYDSNIRPLISDIFGTRVAGNISHMIRTHADATIDWETDSVGTAVRLGDNLALFSREKLPGLFRYVPDNIGVLEDFATKKIGLDEAKSKMKDNISKTDISDSMKTALYKAVGEISPMTPKFTLGMLGGEIDSFEWAGDHLKVNLSTNDETTRLQQLLDLGQRQFGKFAESYGVNPEEFKTSLNMKLKDTRNRIVLETSIVNRSTHKKEFSKKRIVVTKEGTATSGHHEHAGRPGLRGGSLPGKAGGRELSPEEAKKREEYNQIRRMRRFIRILKSPNSPEMKRIAKEGSTVDSVDKVRRGLVDYEGSAALRPGIDSPAVDIGKSWLDNVARRNGKTNHFKTLEQFVHAAYEYTEESTQLHSIVTSAVLNPYGTLVVEGEIKDENGKTVGTFSRDISDMGNVHHGYFRLDDSLQHSGFGSDFYRHSEDAYIAAGCKEISMTANLEVGGYAWAVMGFSMDPYELGGYVNQLQSTYKRAYHTDLPYVPTNVQELAAYIGPDRSKIGKEVLLGSSWHALKKLDPSDDGFVTGRVYYEMKDRKEKGEPSIARYDAYVISEKLKGAKAKKPEIVVPPTPPETPPENYPVYPLLRTISDAQPFVAGNSFIFLGKPVKVVSTTSNDGIIFEYPDNPETVTMNRENAIATQMIYADYGVKPNDDLKYTLEGESGKWTYMHGRFTTGNSPKMLFSRIDRAAGMTVYRSVYPDKVRISEEVTMDTLRARTSEADLTRISNARRRFESQNYLNFFHTGSRERLNMMEPPTSSVESTSTLGDFITEPPTPKPTGAGKPSPVMMMDRTSEHPFVVTPDVARAAQFYDVVQGDRMGHNPIFNLRSSAAFVNHVNYIESHWDDDRIVAYRTDVVIALGIANIDVESDMVSPFLVAAWEEHGVTRQDIGNYAEVMYSNADDIVRARSGASAESYVSPQQREAVSSSITGKPRRASPVKMEDRDSSNPFVVTPFIATADPSSVVVSYPHNSVSQYATSARGIGEVEYLQKHSSGAAANTYRQRVAKLLSTYHIRIRKEDVPLLLAGALASPTVARDDFMEFAIRLFNEQDRSARILDYAFPKKG